MSFMQTDISVESIPKQDSLFVQAGKNKLFRKIIMKKTMESMNDFIKQNNISFIQEFTELEIKELLKSHSKDLLQMLNKDRNKFEDKTVTNTKSELNTMVFSQAETQNQNSFEN